jgi:hypothetical protein
MTHIRRITNRRKLISTGAVILAIRLACLGILSWSFLRLHSEATTEIPLKNATGSASVAILSDYKEKENDEALLSGAAQACARMNSVQDIQDCYPAEYLRPLNSSCHDITDWHDVQRCLMGPRRLWFPENSNNTTSEPPFVIHIIGERHSGTKFAMRQLQQCFLNKPSAARFVRKVHRDFLRTKHFFQPLYRGMDFRRHIVVVIVRNPVDWVAAMIEKPYHAPDHIAAYHTRSAEEENSEKNGHTAAEVIPLPWQDFVSRPWTMRRSQLDMQAMQQNATNSEAYLKIDCQEQFSLDEVIPCQMDEDAYEAIPKERRRGFTPLYELRRDGSGQPFQNILQLRSDKIVNFVLQVPMIYNNLGGFVVVRYDDLLQRGSRFFLEQIARMVGMNELPAECVPADPQPERSGLRVAPEGLRQWVEEHLDKDREKLIGYR